MFRVAAMPPKSPADVVAAMRSAFDELWQDQDFLAGYAKVLATKPIMVSGADGQGILAELGKVPRKIKDFLIDYTSHITDK
jgi:hypothetical protein